MERLSLPATFRFPFLCARDQFEIGQRPVRKVSYSDAVLAFRQFVPDKSNIPLSCDSAIVAVARTLGCRELYTEDMQDGLTIDGPRLNAFSVMVEPQCWGRLSWFGTASQSGLCGSVSRFVRNSGIYAG